MPSGTPNRLSGTLFPCTRYISSDLYTEYNDQYGIVNLVGVAFFSHIFTSL